MTSRAQKPLVRGRSNSEILTSTALLCEQKETERERQTTKKQGLRNIAPLSLQLRSVKKIAKSCDIKELKTNTIFSVNYYQTQKKVFWPLGLKNLNNDNTCQKIASFFLKNAKIRDVKM